MKHLLSSLLVGWALWATTQIGPNTDPAHVVTITDSRKECEQAIKLLYEHVRNDVTQGVGTGSVSQVLVDFPQTGISYMRADGVMVSHRWWCDRSP